MNKKVCYTCITGGYDKIPIHKHTDASWDYVLFTDNAELVKMGKVAHWIVRPLEFDKSTNVKNARWHKINAHILFPEYDYSLWLDGNVIVNNKNIFDKLECLIHDDVLISIPLHPQRNCIYDEAQEILRLHIDVPKTVNKQMRILRRNKYPKNNGLHETNVMFRQHNKIKSMLDLWWSFVQCHSKRDQLSYDYCTWKYGIDTYPLYPNPGTHRTNGDFEITYVATHNQDKIHTAKGHKLKIFKKVRKTNGRIHIYFFGIKIFSWKGKKTRLRVYKNGLNNKVDIPGENIKARVDIYGNNNIVYIGESVRGGNLRIHIRGNNNKIHIMPSSELQSVNINIGNHMEISNSEIFIDEAACIVNIEILVEQHHCKLHVGKKCLMSKDILFRLGEIPHLVFDSETHEYVDTPHDLIIGDHVWIGAGATILKKTKIGNNCIVAARAVVTKEMPGDNVLIAGNPAKIRRKNVYWVGSWGGFTPDEAQYKEKYEQYIKQYGEPSNIL